MKRYIRGTGRAEEFPDVDAFISDIVAVCKKHNMTIEHEDSQGAFIVIRGYCETESIESSTVSE